MYSQQLHLLWPNIHHIDRNISNNNLTDDNSISISAPEDLYEENDDYISAYDLSSFESTWLSSINGLGTQADDDCAGQLGGMLAAMLGIPNTTLVNKLEVQNGKVGIVRELEGGLSEALEIDLPAVVERQEHEEGHQKPKYDNRRLVSVNLEVLLHDEGHTTCKKGKIITSLHR